MNVMSRAPLCAATAKIIAARQQWRCSSCNTLLPPSFQIDHVEPLWQGGSDAENNMQALCPNCHAQKTQRESIERIAIARANQKVARYNEREDKYLSPTAVQCLECKRVRRVGTPHTICWAIEGRPDPNDHVQMRLLAVFARVPRLGADSNDA